LDDPSNRTQGGVCAVNERAWEAYDDAIRRKEG
jgi:hypothetical protein